MHVPVYDVLLLGYSGIDYRLTSADIRLSEVKSDEMYKLTVYRVCVCFCSGSKPIILLKLLW